ncbi:MAG: hypothetical protein PHO07_13610, partial [Pirellulales bacterium]|nr:hypothetical protein [Pirellulales bacterium]
TSRPSRQRKAAGPATSPGLLTPPATTTSSSTARWPACTGTIDPPDGSAKGERGLELLCQVMASDRIEVYRQQNQESSVDTRHVRAVDIALHYDDPIGWRDI